MNFGKDRFIAKERAKAILRERKAQEKREERKKLWKVLKILLLVLHFGPKKVVI